MSDERRPGSAIFKLRRQLISLSDAYWIEDEFGNRAFLLDAKLMLAGRKMLLRDVGGRELYGVKYGVGRLRSKFQLHQQEKVVATAQGKHGLRPHYTVAVEGGDSFIATASLGRRKVAVTHEGTPIARTLDTFFEGRDTVAVEVFDPADAPFALAVIIAVYLSEEHNSRLANS